jgi:hypothetical protein
MKEYIALLLAVIIGMSAVVIMTNPTDDSIKIAYFKFGEHTIRFHPYYINVSTGAFDILSNTSGTEYINYSGSSDKINVNKPIELGNNELTCTDCIDTGEIIDNTITDADFNQASVYFLNYSDAGTYTANKIIVANGSTFTGTVNTGESALSTIDYIVATVTTNSTCVVAISGVSGNTFTLTIYDVSTGAVAVTSESVNWTAVGI